MTGAAPIRVLALIYPIERHVGHWATSSHSIRLLRIVMEGDALGEKILLALRDFQPQAIAIIGKRTTEYLDLLDALAQRVPSLQTIPRIYRCQNTVLAARLAALNLGALPDKQLLAEMDAWFARACDPRFSLVLVQTLDDVELIRQALAPVRVAACPYGYDPAIFDPDLPELPRITDVGCYFSLRGDPRRVRLVETAQAICGRQGWRFLFVEGAYWHEYARQIRTTRVCLHQSDQGEVPYRLYETTALGSVFLSDPLQHGVETLFDKDREYLTFQPDLSDLEEALCGVLKQPARWQSVAAAGRARARRYTWAQIADAYVAPVLREMPGPEAVT
jgi:hypothetical protein